MPIGPRPRPNPNPNLRPRRGPPLRAPSRPESPADAAEREAYLLGRPAGDVTVGYWRRGVYVGRADWWMVVLASDGWQIDGVAVPATAAGVAYTHVVLYRGASFYQSELRFPTRLDDAQAEAYLARAEAEWTAAVLSGDLPGPGGSKTVVLDPLAHGPAEEYPAEPLQREEFPP